MRFNSAMPAVLVASIVLPIASAHTVMTTLFVDGVNQGDGVCIRMNNDGNTANTYIQPITSANIACGIQGEIGGARVCPAKASSTLTFEFRENPCNQNSDSIAPSHKGPAAVYLKKVDSAIASNNAAGNGWFKIWESVYDEAAGKWGTEKMIANNGHISVTVPSDIEGGYYLARTELLALHAADEGDPQFYVGCAQLFISSNGTAKPPTVTIGEGTYDLSMPAMTYNIYTTPLALPYPMYGPAVYTPGASSSSSSSVVPSSVVPSSVVASSVVASSSAAIRTATVTAVSAGSSSVKAADTVVATSVPKSKESKHSDACQSSYHLDKKRSDVLVQTEGLKPEGCIFVNGNWCGYEVPDYSDQNSCWTASNDCWSQSDDCWNKTQPTGYNYCQTWQDEKCQVIQTQCSEASPSGPPNKGVDFTPKWPSLQGSTKVFTKRNWKMGKWGH